MAAGPSIWWSEDFWWKPSEVGGNIFKWEYDLARQDWLNKFPGLKQIFYKESF